MTGFMTGAYTHALNWQKHEGKTPAEAEASAVRKAMGYDVPEATTAQKLEVASGTLSIAGFLFAPFKFIAYALDALSVSVAGGYAYVTGDPSKLITNAVGRYAGYSVKGIVPDASRVRYSIVIDTISGIPTREK